MDEKEWLLEEVYSNEFRNTAINQNKVSVKIQKMKSMSLFDIAKKLDSKPNLFKLDNED